MIQKSHLTSGSAIMIILITVALFGALSWAWMENSRSSTGWLMNEQTKAAVTASAECQNHIDAALQRLESRGCGSFLTTDASGTLSGTAGEPTDGSCALYHPNGGGVKPCGGIVPISDACAGSPAPGTLCGDGTIYVDLSPDGNVKMYTTAADGLGPGPWNDGSTNWLDLDPVGTCLGSGQPTCRTGTANTALIMTFAGGASPAPHIAGEHCGNLVSNGHSDWYLPSMEEMQLVFTHRNTGSLSGTLALKVYWSSSEIQHDGAIFVPDPDLGWGTWGSATKTNGNRVRCVRKD